MSCEQIYLISEEVKAVGNWLIWVAIKALVMSWPGLLPRPMSGFISLMQFVMLFMTPDTTEGREDTCTELILPLTCC